MNQTTNTTAGIDLDKLEEHARKQKGGMFFSTEEALALIQLARRSTSGSDGTAAAGVAMPLRERFADAYLSLSVAYFNSPFWNQSMEELLTAVDAEINKRVVDRMAATSGSELAIRQIEEIADEHSSGKNSAGNYLFRPLALIKFARAIEAATSQPAALTRQPAAAVCQPLADERAKFKAWWGKRVPAGDDSDHAGVFAFEVWQAALAQQAGAPEIGCGGTGKYGDMPCLGCDACPRDGGQQAVAPAGYKLVPIVPTEQMLNAAMAGASYDSNMAVLARRGLIGNYGKMVAAAPAPAAQDERDAKDAARYRFLIKDGCSMNGRFTLVKCDPRDGQLIEMHGREYDAAIDAAMSQSKTHGTAGQDGAAC